MIGNGKGERKVREERERGKGKRKGKEAGRKEERREAGRKEAGKRKGERNQRVRRGVWASGIASHDILPHAYDSVLIIPLSRFCGVVAYALCEVRVCQQPYDSVGQSLC